MVRFDTLCIDDARRLVFGRAPHPVQCGLDLRIGAGDVHPELNFTLPAMAIEPDTWPRVVERYDATVAAVLTRARVLDVSGLVVEFEHLPPMTERASWGAELTERIAQQLRAAHEAWGLKAALRVTVVDLRDGVKPPRRRRGEAWEQMAASLRACAAAGADILSIESTGGKEVHDPALTRADTPGIVFALGVLAARDMAWLWDRFTETARTTNRHVVPGGDTACGFANTAMQLAGQQMLPDVLAALVRAMSAARTLVAHEHGAVGPSKDCAYENPIIKAITGCPISMEGRSATCAHLSPVGNIAGAAADLWSNESVPDVRLLSGPAPLACFESLVYDCRLFNTATRRAAAGALRDIHVSSDAGGSAQGALMTPEATIRIAQAIVEKTGSYERVRAAGRAALALLREALAERRLNLPARERRWLDKLERDFDGLPDEPDELRARIAPRYGALYDAAEYGLLP